MPKFFCDYCDVYLTHDSMSVRKAHNSGRNHIRNVVDYYQAIGQEKAQSVIDSITDSYAAEGQANNNPLLRAQPFGPPGGFAHGMPPPHMMGGPNMPSMPFPIPGMPFPQNLPLSFPAGMPPLPSGMPPSTSNGMPPTGPAPNGQFNRPPTGPPSGPAGFPSQGNGFANGSPDVSLPRRP